MNKLDLDFAPRGWLFWVYRLDKRMLLLGCLACVAMLSGWSYWRAIEQDAERMAQEQARLIQSQERQKPKAAAMPKLSEAQLKASQAVIRQLNQPWMDLLQSMETTRKGGVALLELRLDSNSDRIRGVAEAKNPQEMLRFISQMKAQTLFNSVELHLHQINQSDPNKPYRFEFSAHWQQEGGRS